jgi:hypothetical protein
MLIFKRLSWDLFDCVIRRVKDVSAAVDGYEGSTDEIWEKNIATMKDVGPQKMKKTIDKINIDAKKS